jgi:emfourin
VNGRAEDGVQIEFAETGGIGFFPGLSRPVVVDLDRLEAPVAEGLQRLVEAARFFELPATVGVPPAGAADYQQAVLTIEDQGHRHQVTFLVPIADPTQAELVAAVRREARALRRASAQAKPPQ